MNLDKCTPGQRTSIKHVSGPLLVSAGAGSGKTFTLTQRIAYALLPESGPAAQSIDEVLAITFTEKAASEIKARVKRTLRAEGLFAEALKVDGAWISTIHGMCARILRTHALDLGLDPAFGIIGDAERADLIADAIDRALGDDNEIIARGSYAALFDEFPARASLPSAPSIAAMLQALLDKAVGLRGGLAAVDFGPEPARASELARALLLAYEGIIPALEQAGGSTTAERARTQAADAIEALQGFIAQYGVGETCDNATELRALAGVVDSCERIGGNFKAAVKEDIKAFQAQYAQVVQQIALGMAYPLTTELMNLAREVARHYEKAKRTRCMLDNDDLLVKTLEAFEQHPEITQRYEVRFKLVMVDEFQDTSQLQIDMIARLAGKQCAHLCTVGDAQQSIYRFRGADVNVYEQHRRDMESAAVGARSIQLTKNFRSHADVLSFVDRIFEQPQVFGDAFMSLEPDTNRLTRYRSSTPRINMVLATLPAGRGTGMGVADAKLAAARAIARHFAALRADGHAAGDMVVLLGKMSRAEMYAEALRAEGFECVVAGGSLFAKAAEVRVVARLVEALANPANTAALFEVLTSDMIRLSADDFLELTTEEDPETGLVRRRDLDRGFARLSGHADELSARLAHAVRLFDQAQRHLRTQPVSAVVRDMLVRSGWMMRLERQGATGMACAANVLKAVRLIERIESERHVGLASVARAFSEELAVGLKEAPGALSGAHGDVVKIMTIHASKGLEFPIVALADFADVRSRSSRLLVETCGSCARASLAPGASLNQFPQFAKRTSMSSAIEDEGEDADCAAARRLVAGVSGPSDICTQAAYRAALTQHAADEELAEARRKLYVGLTRASEALVVAMDAKAPSASKPPTYAALVDDIRSALCGAEDFPEGEADLAYGGSASAHFERVMVVPVEEGINRAVVQDACQRFVVPRMTEETTAPRVSWNATRQGVFSYSSIAPVQKVDKEAQQYQDVPEVERGFNLLSTLDDDQSPASADVALSCTADLDKATGLGSAFHRAAQFAVETGRVPIEQHLQALCSTYSLTEAQGKRLRVACAQWFTSATYAETTTWSLRRAEVPFFVHIGTAFMEGELDLLCSDGPEGSAERALVIDYKTGGHNGESAASLYEKHLLQAQCYAYALLCQGYSAVELRFVRVEHVGEAGDPQMVRYVFGAQDSASLAVRILSARG